MNTIFIFTQNFKIIPEISRFLGIAVRMFYNEHNPPHFHAYYNEHQAEILIQTLEIKQESLLPKVYNLVVEWALTHREN